MSKLPSIPLMMFAWLGYAQTTTIEVPQGSGVFPTIGQVNLMTRDALVQAGRAAQSVWEDVQQGEWLAAANNAWGDAPWPSII